MKLQAASFGYTTTTPPDPYEPPERRASPRIRALAVTIGAALLCIHACIALAWCAGGCASVPAFQTTPREQARATIRVLAEGVHEADHRCAEIGIAASNLPLLDNCAKAYAIGRSSLLVASGAVDAWDDGRAGETACATATGLTAALEMASLIRSSGGTVPPALEDGLRLAKQFGAVCTDGGTP